MKPSNTEHPDYYHKIVDCQYACPAHTPVPQYIRLIAEKKYTEAYLLNRASNVFPGVLGRVCDRPCEPACRRGRLEDEKPVAICRLKRVAADFKTPQFEKFLRPIPEKKNGNKIALIGAGPASLTVINDLLPLGYTCVLFEKEGKAGGAMLTQVPNFRLPQTVLDEEIAAILERGKVSCHFNKEIRDIDELLPHYDAVFIGTGAPDGKTLPLQHHKEAAPFVQTGIEFLAKVSFEHIEKMPEETLVIGGGNTAMDCCRTALRLGAKKVKVVAPESYNEMLASPWEKEDALAEHIPILNGLLPMEYILEEGKLVGLKLQKLQSCYDKNKKWNPIPAEGVETLSCNAVILAIGQKLAFPFIKKNSGIEFQKPEEAWAQLKVHQATFQSSNPKVFVGGDAAWGPKNIIWAVAHGHEAAISIHKFLTGADPSERPPLKRVMESQKISLNQWSYANSYDAKNRQNVPHEDTQACISNIGLEVEKGFTPELSASEAARCLNCDVQTVFFQSQCIECDACIDICPVDCLGLFINQEENLLRDLLLQPAKNHSQALFAAEVPQTQRMMVKDENICLHCGLCAERCPTGAWEMQKFELNLPQAKDL